MLFLAALWRICYLGNYFVFRVNCNESKTHFGDLGTRAKYKHCCFFCSGFWTKIDSFSWNHWLPCRRCRAVGIYSAMVKYTLLKLHPWCCCMHRISRQLQLICNNYNNVYFETDLVLPNDNKWLGPRQEAGMNKSNIAWLQHLVCYVQEFCLTRLREGVTPNSRIFCQVQLITHTL